MIRKKSLIFMVLYLFAIAMGFVNIILAKDEYCHVIFVLYVSVVLFLSIFKDDGNWVSPYSYLIISFFVFVWMRYILNILFGIQVVSAGKGINDQNVNLVAAYLGIAINIMCITSLIVEESFLYKKTSLFEEKKRVSVSQNIEIFIVLLAVIFFLAFLLDSIKKIDIISTHDYLAVSETIMVQGYQYFSYGKYFILLWILLGKNENRFFWGSIILMFAGLGYLMRGARGYAIMYIFMCLLFLSYRHKLKKVWIFALGIGLIYLANFILSYRLGWNVASGFWGIVFSTLNSQGASVETVFGSVVFSEQIHEKIDIFELLISSDFGTVVDHARGINFISGGYGSSFFAEAFFMGFPLGFIFVILAGICLGILECANKVIRQKKSGYAQMLIFMTIPNLIYLGRSSLKDFIFKTIITILILCVSQFIAQRNI